MSRRVSRMIVSLACALACGAIAPGVAGAVAIGIADGLQPGQGDRFVLARYLLNGTLDSRFGRSGVVATTLPGGDALGEGIARQRDGRLVVVGQADQPDGKTSIFGVVRYTANGVLDSTFGARGVVTTGFGKRNLASANAVAIQRNGRILAAGGTTSRFALARYLAVP
jgi:uncharacterized delta-60 repeat protein